MIKLKFFRSEDEIDWGRYNVATYFIESSISLHFAAWNIAIGQSVGNPNVRNKWENEALFDEHSCLIIGDESQLKALRQGEVKIAFPQINTNWKSDGVSHFLCQLMGGHVDIKGIDKCRLIDFWYASAQHQV